MTFIWASFLWTSPGVSPLKAGAGLGARTNPAPPSLWNQPPFHSQEHGGSCQKHVAEAVRVKKQHFRADETTLTHRFIKMAKLKRRTMPSGCACVEQLEVSHFAGGSIHCYNHFGTSVSVATKAEHMNTLSDFTL
ncbi:hypothetical protein mRhiFer1_009296 [Rhinolophus ferrumequinum]|uniref:Secreted protein n=1 Tax=Rhinolophus ferrumequinum TaxID=59479 RepID=A0A7J7RY46_RHIFE|nr:hypothetical protein mRhiFer1_009296 [Rhinolophus ferrumequinum]